MPAQWILFRGDVKKQPNSLLLPQANLFNVFDVTVAINQNKVYHPGSGKTLARSAKWVRRMDDTSKLIGK